MIEIARQDRPSLYDQWADRPPPLVRRAVARSAWPGGWPPTGPSSRPVEPGAGLPPIEAEAVAVCLLHADLDAGHERRRGGARCGRAATT